MLLMAVCTMVSAAQEVDSLQVLEEVVVIGRKKELNLKQTKPLTSIDDYLQQSSSVTMVRRGSYAWEPMINNMASERTLVTIEGMHIFGACTDKMDPITSYVEVSNLSEAQITSGQHGSGYGSTIGGAIDLKRNRVDFTTGWQAGANLGFETTNRQKIAGASVSYSQPKYFVDTDFMFRDAENYHAGSNREVLYSGFTKMNFSAMSGLKLGNHILEGSLIYDKATDVGYPALPMDVSLAEALIASLRFEMNRPEKPVSSWESKIYFNTVTHRMDDTTRPDVAIHMDMPGWATTFGGYSSIKGVSGKNRFRGTLNSYVNSSKAEMTMYPENPSELPMYMLTWPDVRTVFNGISVENLHEFNCHLALKMSGGVSSHSNSVESDEGLESIRIFYPDAPKSNLRILKTIAATLYLKKGLEYSIGAGYGERAPSVSEGYGFYLFNSFDNYDYLGNPSLSNEKSFELNASVAHQKEKSKLKLSARLFQIHDYIAGIPDPAILPMTLGANGVKVYRALDAATIFNIDLETEFAFTKSFIWQSQLAYSKGQDDDGNPLPFMSPLRYRTSLTYKYRSFKTDLILRGNGTQSDFAERYGEDKTPSFAIIDVNFGYNFPLSSNKIYLNAGVENILDAYYSTYSDWNNIPRPGRNVFVNVVAKL